MSFKIISIMLLFRIYSIVVLFSSLLCHFVKCTPVAFNLSHLFAIIIYFIEGSKKKEIDDKNNHKKHHFDGKKTHCGLHKQTQIKATVLNPIECAVADIILFMYAAHTRTRIKIQ